MFERLVPSRHLRRRSPGPRAELDALCAMRLAHRVPVQQPLVLISQVNRSGGTLLSQLLSGHPQCHARPGELQIGKPKDEWPEITPNSNSRRCFERLYEPLLTEYSVEGYVKVPRRVRAGYDPADITFPFLFLPSLMQTLFERELAGGVRDQRQVLDAYFTAFFNAWLDYQQLYTPKQWVVAFTPGLSSREDSVARFFRDYPDGRLLSSVRDPRSWFVSLRGKQPGLTPDKAMPRWIRSAEQAIQNRRRFGERVRLVSFETLLEDTPGTMARVADWLDLAWDDVLTRPSFQGFDIRANSSWKVERAGVLDAPLQRARELAPQDLASIEQSCLELYEEVLRNVA